MPVVGNGSEKLVIEVGHGYIWLTFISFSPVFVYLYEFREVKEFFSWLCKEIHVHTNVHCEKSHQKMHLISSYFNVIIL